MGNFVKSLFGWHVGVSYLNQNVKKAKADLDKADQARSKELDRLIQNSVQARKDMDKYMAEIEVQATMPDFIHRWFITDDVYLWLVDYYRCPDERVLVRSVTDQGFSITKEIKTDGARRFKFEGRRFTVPDKYKPRMFNPYHEAYEEYQHDRQKTR